MLTTHFSAVVENPPSPLGCHCNTEGTGEWRKRKESAISGE